MYIFIMYILFIDKIHHYQNNKIYFYKIVIDIIVFVNSNTLVNT